MNAYETLLATLLPDCTDEEGDGTCEEGARCRTWYDELAFDIWLALPPGHIDTPRQEIIEWLLTLNGPEENGVHELAQEFIKHKENAA